MSKLKSIAFDLDGVLWSAGDVVAEMYNEKYSNHSNFTKADFSKCLRWDMSDTMPLANSEWMEEVFNSSDFFDRIVLFDGIEDMINRLHEIGNRIVFVSRCGIKNARYKLSFLNKKFPYAIHLPVIADWNTMLDKDWINLKDCCFIDDKKSNLESSNATHKILFNEHGNYDVDWAKGWKGLKADSIDNLSWIISMILEVEK